MKWTNERLIAEGTERFGNRFDYSLIDVKDKETKVAIKCNVCGTIFYQAPSGHAHSLQGGCPTCRYGYVAQHETIPFETFIEKAKVRHGDKYQYDQSTYKGMKYPIRIICPEHGEFWQVASGHLNCGCNLCGNEQISRTLTYDKETVLKKFRNTHGNKYDYSLVEYVASSQKVKIICREHGVFEQTPANHWKGEGCPICAHKEVVDTARFIEKAKLVHGDRYNYSKVNYIDAHTKVEIICKEHGSFYQEPQHHLAGCGCQSCKTSLGESKVAEYLDKIGIKYNRQFTIQNESLFGNRKRMYLDFYMPSLNVAIEYNGEQHYMAVKHWGGEQAFERQQERDYALRQYCKEHKIKLIEIPYTEYDNIENILAKELKFDKNKA